MNDKINIAVGCIMASKIDINTKQEIINLLRDLERKSERDNGCKYCDPENIFYYYGGKVPNFCKHCGRKLDVERDRVYGELEETK